MRYEDQILKLPEYTIAFLSDTSLVVAKDIEKTLSFEKMRPLDDSIKIKKIRSIGTTKFYVTTKTKVTYVVINDKKYILDDIIRNAESFENIDLKNTNKFLVYKKGKSSFISLPEDGFTYLNRSNVLLKKQLGNIIYFRDITREELLERVKILFKMNMPVSSIILDDKVIENSDLKDIEITYTNDLSPNNNFFFINDNNIKVSNTGVKQVLTFGFSRNNSLNCFDVNMCNTFSDLKHYLTLDFNYNKNYFNNKNYKPSSNEFIVRLTQLNTFLPVMLFDYNKVNDIALNEDDDYLNIIIKYSTLRHRLIPFLYSSFKNKRLYYKEVYKQTISTLEVDNQLLLFPIYAEVDKVTKQRLIPVTLSDIYYDFQTHEKYKHGISNNFFPIDTMPLFAKSGSIIPLDVLNKEKEYEILIFPNKSTEYIFHYDEYVVDEIVRHAYSTFKLDYSTNKLLLTITPHSIDELLPKILYLNFVNIKKNSTITVNGTTFKQEYNQEKKHFLIDVFETNNIIEIEITNEFGLELDRTNEFIDKKLKKFFEHIDCDDKEKTIYKYKIRPYLHESIDSIITRIDKQIKFINNKHKKSLYKMLEMYKK